MGITGSIKKLWLVNLTATVAALATWQAPAQAFKFGTSGIQFDFDTEVEFTFYQSRGAFQSILKIFQVNTDNTLTWVKDLFAETRASDNWSANGWLGTCGEGKTVQGSCSVSFTFLKGTMYTLGLDSGENGKVYSTSALNTAENGTLWLSELSPAGSQQAVFGSFGSLGADGTRFDNPQNFQSADPFAGLVKISFDDRGARNALGIPDLDYQDFSVTAQARPVASVPEPATLGGLGLVGCALAARRRQRSIT
ncbi:MAG: PEP-CTERM sorting domain-containing protein [Oscillatoriaceae bacterium SKW80]|nr:PEP-CTERM sorting domain-containing protein [Oscillatoriaceae bacterium SKW80]HIK27097.1 PEP-CTERM sorting domain-containing protein [Oscillatoriaceae cyanobacterium M7585_C2015_266]